MQPSKLAELIRDVPDFPKPGVVFRDITTLIADRDGFAAIIDLLVARYRDQKIDTVLAIESRGFIFGGALAHGLHCGLQVVRKPGKLPWRTRGVSYALEYGTDTLEIHEDAIRPGDRVVIVDDVLATGGTMDAVAGLVASLDGTVVECAFVLELTSLKGRDRLGKWRNFSLIQL